MQRRIRTDQCRQTPPSTRHPPPLHCHDAMPRTSPVTALCPVRRATAGRAVLLCAVRPFSNERLNRPDLTRTTFEPPLGFRCCPRLSFCRPLPIVRLCCCPSPGRREKGTRGESAQRRGGWEPNERSPPSTPHPIPPLPALNSALSPSASADTTITSITAYIRLSPSHPLHVSNLQSCWCWHECVEARGAALASAR